MHNVNAVEAVIELNWKFCDNFVALWVLEDSHLF